MVLRAAMLPIRIDFRSESEAATPAGIALLVAGAFLTAAGAAWTASLLAEIGQVESGIADIEGPGHRLDGHGSGQAREVRRQVRQANLVVQEMTIPWDRLFRGLESAEDDEVALLELEPDAAKRTVRISGEAKHLEAMLEYSRRLERTGTLDRVVLLGHEIRIDDAQRPVAFSLSAAWRESP
jgi:hypothetical protein